MVDWPPSGDDGPFGRCRTRLAPCHPDRVTGQYRLGYRPALDGLRGVAVLLVVIAHSIDRSPSAGTIGVTLFFLLSGFLITRLLVEEHARSGQIDIVDFLGRRARRLVPALALYVLFIAAAGETWPTLLAAALYFSNVLGISNGTLGVFDGHLWSLSMEEQFYLLWPAVLILGLRRRRLLIAAGAIGIVMVELWRWWLVSQGAPPARLQYGPDVRIDAILIGCLLALAADQLRRWPTQLALVGAVVIAAGSAMHGVEASPWMLPLATVACVPVVMVAATRSVPVLEGRAIVGLGKVSYGVYLWHYAVARLLSRELPFWAVLAITLVFSVTVAVISYRLIEMPVRRWRRGRSASRPSDGPSMAGATTGAGSTPGQVSFVPANFDGRADSNSSLQALKRTASTQTASEDIRP